MKNNIKLKLIRLLQFMFSLFDIVELKAKYAKDKLSDTYKCICIAETYFIVSSNQRDHTFDHYCRLTWIGPNQRNVKHRTGLRLDRIPHGTTELLAWSDAFNKICNKI